MEIEHSETIRPLVEAPFFESSDSPPLFIAYMREVGAPCLATLRRRGPMQNQSASQQAALK